MPFVNFKSGFLLKVMFTLLAVTLYFVPGTFGRSGLKLYSAGNNLAWNSPASWSLSVNGVPAGLVPQFNDTVIIDCIIIQNVNFTFSDFGHLEIQSSGLLRGDNLDLNFSGSSSLSCFGELKTGNLTFTQNAALVIQTKGIVKVTNSSTIYSSGFNIISGNLLVSGVFSVGLNTDIAGSGTIIASNFDGNGSAFGITPVSVIPDGVLISENNWLGSLNDIWNEPMNWSNGLVPVENANISILPSSNNPQYTGKTIYGNLHVNSQAVLAVLPSAVIEIGGTLSVNETGKLILKNTSTEKSSLILNGDVSGKIQSEYPVIAGQNSLVSSPVDLAVSGTFLSMYLREYDESSSQWGSYIVPTEDPLQVMRGYEVYSLFSETRIFDGTPNLDSKTFDISNSGNGLNLTGNPFTSYIDWESNDNNCWERSSVASAIYYPDPSGSGNFSVYLPGGDEAVTLNNGSRYISPMQGFFVKASQQGLLTVTENSQVRNFNDSPVVLKNNSIKFKLKDSEGLSDEALFRVISNSTSRFDDDYDALKLVGLISSPSIYLEADDNVNYAVNTIPSISSSLDIPLNIICSDGGTFTISTTGSFNFEFRYPVILEDKELEKFIDLRADSVYTFYHSPEMSSKRFEIHFNSPDGIDNQNEINTEIIVINGEVKIKGNDNNVYTANLFSVDGKFINSNKGILSEGISLTAANQSCGIYLLQLFDGKHTMNKKIYLK